MSLIDLYRAFQRDAIQQEFPPSARVLGDTMIYQFNEARWIDSLAFSERDLMHLTGLKKTTLHEAKHFLTCKGILKCQPFKNKTSYSLGEKWAELAATSYRPVGDQLPTSRRPVGDQFSEVPIIRACEDVKTLDLKTFTSFDDDNAGARVCVNRNFEDGVTATPVDTPAEPIDTLTEYWERDLHGGRLTIEHLSEIQALIDKYGFDWVKEAMQTAADSNGSAYGVSMKLFRAVVRRKLNPVKPAALKGGERRDRGNESARRNVVALPDTYDPERDPVDWRQYLTGTGTSAERP